LFRADDDGLAATCCGFRATDKKTYSSGETVTIAIRATDDCGLSQSFIIERVRLKSRDDSVALTKQPSSVISAGPVGHCAALFPRLLSVLVSLVPGFPALHSVG
jgi:hypothetical protein